MTKFTRPYDGFLHDKPMAVPEGEHHPRFEIASPYWPASFHNDPPSKLPLQILHIIRAGWEEMRAEDPNFFLGMTLHGSLIKGRSHDESDIDPIIVADENVAAATLQKHGVNYMQEASYEPYISAKNFLTTRFQQIMKAPLADAGLPESFAKSEVWSPIVLPDPQRYFTTIVPRYRKMLTWCLKHDKELFFPYPVEMIFRMRVGSGHIQDFRRSVIDSIERLNSKKHPDLAVLAWQGLAKNVVKEEELNREATIYFPQTTKDAREYFRL